MLNGNLTGYLKIDCGSNVFIRNTCPFDAISQVLAEMYIMNNNCRTEFENSDNCLYEMARKLALDGGVSTTYKRRAEILAGVLKPEETSLSLSRR